MLYQDLLKEISSVNNSTQAAVAKSVNQIMTLRNWLIGAYIIEFEQEGSDRAAYGAQLLENLARDLLQRGIKGFSLRNLKNFRQFSLTYPGLSEPGILTSVLASSVFTDPASGDLSHLNLGKRQTVSAKSDQLDAAQDSLTRFSFPSLHRRAQTGVSLPWQDGNHYQRLITTLSWSHLLELSRVTDPVKRAFYELESIKGNWSQRELKRQIQSLLYERVGLSKDKEAVLALAEEGQIVQSPAAMLRDPYVLEFLDLEERVVFTESDLEQALQFISQLANTVTTLGKPVFEEGFINETQTDLYQDS